MTLGVAWFVVLSLSLTGDPGRADRARVIADALDVFDHPDPTAYATSQLERGDEVIVRAEGPGPWLAIDAPRGEFLWAQEEALRIQAGGVAEVIVPHTTVRSGRDHTRMPGPPNLVIEGGTILRLVDRPPLELRQGHDRRVWRAIAPPEGTLRYVRASGIALPPVRSRVTKVSSSSIAPGPVISQLVATGPAPPDGSLATREMEGFRQLDSQHRAMLRRPLADWQLESVRAGYRSLLEQVGDPLARAALQDRVDRTTRQIAAAEAARRFNETVAQARLLDQKLAVITSQSKGTPSVERTEFDATGLLMPSSKLTDGGDRVWALIGPDGVTRAYLHVPPGISAPHMVGREVGVRGQPHNDASLHALVIDVQEMETLGAAMP